jgi:hypothetical protein
MTITRFRLTVDIEAPFLSHGNTAAGFGLDAMAARDATGAPILPGTLIAGRLSHAWRAWGKAGAPFLQCLGQGSDQQAGSFDPFRKCLVIGDLCLQGTVSGGNDSRIRLDPDTGAVAKGALFMAEQLAPPGTRLRFSGPARLAAGNDPAATARAVEAALLWAGCLGAGRAVGQGRILDVSCESVIEAVDLPPMEECALSLEFEAPFCVPEKSLGQNNLFEGREVIPGAVLKGALASTWAAFLGKAPDTPVSEALDSARQALGRHFDKLIFRHAFPLKDGARALSLPQSLVKAGKRFCDVADYPVARRLKDHEEKDVAPAFSIDWKSKDYGQVMPALGWPDLRKETRVRTAIEPGTGRAKDEQLFAYECVVPGDTRWGLNLSFATVPEADQAAVRDQLAGLLYALGGEIGWIGKTKTFARLQPKPAFPTHRAGGVPSTLKKGDTVKLQLQTDALMGDWKALDEAADVEKMREMYDEAFRQLSGGALNLYNYFARQKLLGGKYFWKRHGAGAPYRPWLLTEAGSVFVLEVLESEAAGALLECWLERGLPLPAWLEKEALESEAKGRPRWQTIPYLPEGGYGEILINADTALGDAS